MTRLRSLFYLSIMAVTVIVYSIPIVTLGWFMPLRWGGHQPKLGASQPCRPRIDLRSRLPRNGYREPAFGRLYRPIQAPVGLGDDCVAGVVTPGACLGTQTRADMGSLLRLGTGRTQTHRHRPQVRTPRDQAVAEAGDCSSEWWAAGRDLSGGTRVAPGTRKKYGIGGAMLAEKSGAPVIPIAHNAGVFWRRRDIDKYPGTIDLVVGLPIHTVGHSVSAINASVEDWIETTVASLPSSHR